MAEPARDRAPLVWSKAPFVVGAHDAGPLIRSKSGVSQEATGCCAIREPLSGTSHMPESGGGRITPGEWERRRGLRLRFVCRRTSPGRLAAEGRLNPQGQAVVSRSKSGRSLLCPG